MERRRVGHKGATPALGAHQALINEHLKGVAYGAARQPRFVHEFHVGRQFVSACVDAGGDAVTQHARQALVLGQFPLDRNAHTANLYPTFMPNQSSKHVSYISIKLLVMNR